MKKVFTIIIMIIVLVIDRIGMLLFFNKDIPSVKQINQFPKLRKELRNRTILKMIIVVPLIVIWIVVKLIF